MHHHDIFVQLGGNAEPVPCRCSRSHHCCAWTSSKSSSSSSSSSSPRLLQRVPSYGGFSSLTLTSPLVALLRSHHRHHHDDCFDHHADEDHLDEPGHDDDVVRAHWQCPSASTLQALMVFDSLPLLKASKSHWLRWLWCSLMFIVKQNCFPTIPSHSPFFWL